MADTQVKSGPTVWQMIMITLLGGNLLMCVGTMYVVHSAITAASIKVDQVVELTRKVPPMLDRVEADMDAARKQVESMQKMVKSGFDKLPDLSKGTVKGMIDGLRDGLNTK